MIQRFFLNGINLHRSGMRVAQAVEFSAFVRANEAEPRLPFPDVAMPRAKITMRLAAGLGLPPAGFMQLRGFLEDLQALHRVLPSSQLYARTSRPAATVNVRATSLLRARQNTDIVA